MKLVQKEGYWCPDTDVKNERGDDCFDYIYAELPNVNCLVDACLEFGIPMQSCIHAGGNIGMYAMEFAKHFERVYTFEPNDDNFSALALNCHMIQNIFPYKACLGYTNKPAKLTEDCNGNIGAWRVTGRSGGHIPTLKIDDLGLDDVKLIHLDIEGYEIFALKGAERTIRRCKPLIAFEILDHFQDYGYKYNHIEEYLVSLGYNISKPYGNEVMFYFKEQ